MTVLMVTFVPRVFVRRGFATTTASLELVMMDYIVMAQILAVEEVVLHTLVIPVVVMLPTSIVSKLVTPVAVQTILTVPQQIIVMPEAIPAN